MKFVSCMVLALVGVGCNDEGVSTTPSPSSAELVTRSDIVTDQKDATLVNAWGLAFNPRGFAWVSAAGSGLSEVYDVNGNHVIPSVVIPAPGGGTSSPTGQVFNPDANAFKGDNFIFATEDGTIAGWQQSFGAAAMMRIDNSASGAIYKGVALGASRLYAANFHAGTVDVWDGSYQRVQAGFHDPQLPAGFAPFNVAVVQGLVLVSFAKQDDMAHDDVKGAGNGFVDLFDAAGNLQARLLSGGELNSPWGMTVAPGGFAAAPGRLLVGNFGDGTIHSYDLDLANRRALLAGTLGDQTGAPLVIDGLWALQFGPGAGGFAVDQLYFTGGPNDEANGVFGRLSSTGGTVNTGGTTTGGTTTGGTTPGGTTTGGTTTGGTTTGGTTGGYMP